jgi:hypothetical protein
MQSGSEASGEVGPASRHELSGVRQNDQPALPEY